MASSGFIFSLFLFFTVFFQSIVAHMIMAEPPPINYKTNPFYDVSKADFDYSAPLSPSGSNYPCRGHLKWLGQAVAKPVRTYKPGGTYELRFDGSATHAGGSCQVALSYDKGKTYKAIKSFIGGCVGPQPGAGQTFNFKIPSDAPAGDEVIFAWTWFNNQGNREMYMNCAVVTISGGRSKRDSEGLTKRALSGPDMFIANIGNGCGTPAGTDVVFPNPGKDVQYGGDTGKRAPPTGNNCGAFVGNPPPDNNGGGNNGGNNGGESSRPTPSPTKNTPRPTPTRSTTIPGGTSTRKLSPIPTPTPGNTDNDPGSDPDNGNDNGNDNGDGNGNGNNGEKKGEGIGKGSCEYWRSQGYVCNDASTLNSRSVTWWIVPAILWLWVLH